MRTIPKSPVLLLGLSLILAFVAFGCGELGPIEPWDCCPGPEVFESPGGDWAIEAGNRARYCAIPGGTEPEQVFSHLAQLLLLEGTYQVPAEPGDYSVSLPLCLKLPEQEPQPTQEESGTLRVEPVSQTYAYVLRAWYEQSLQTPTGDPWLLTGRIVVTFDDDLPPVQIDGSVRSDVTFTLQGPQDAWGTTLFGCGQDSSSNDAIQVSFKGGYVYIQLEIVSHFVAGGVPIGFLRSATGNLDGETFTQTDYWSLAYVGGHHGWVNDYFIRFDEPIGQVCGMWITDERYPEFSATVRLLDCGLSVLEER